MTFPVAAMPIGRAMWTLIVMAIIGALAIVGTAGCLLFFYIAQHVRFI